MVTSSHTLRCFVALLLTLLTLELASCNDTADNDSDTLAPLGRLVQALTDTDSDAMDDGWEVTHFGNLSATSTADSDTDGMTNGEEYLHGFVPTVNDAFDDADGDRYPNVFEVRSGSDPNSQSSIAMPTYLVNGAGGGTHTTISAALSAANVANGAYQIHRYRAGRVHGSREPFQRQCVVDDAEAVVHRFGGCSKDDPRRRSDQLGMVYPELRRDFVADVSEDVGAVRVQTPAKEVRFVDLIVRDNTSSTSTTPGLQVSSVATGGKVYVVGSTFLDNTGAPTVKQIYIAFAAVIIVNTVVWSQTSGTMVGVTAHLC